MRWRMMRWRRTSRKKWWKSRGRKTRRLIQSRRSRRSGKSGRNGRNGRWEETVISEGQRGVESGTRLGKRRWREGFHRYHGKERVGMRFQRREGG